MGAIRMYFKKGKDCWEYGYITVNKWMELTFSLALNGDRECFEYFNRTGGNELLENLKQGEALFSYAQTLVFFQATDFLSRIIISDNEPLREHLFSFVEQFSKRFSTIKEFEDYYLDYSTGLLDKARKEFEKEPELKGKLDILLGMDLSKY